jgi:DNA helicase-2/ATP-dependent DNA helicase PcrA
VPDLSGELGLISDREIEWVCGVMRLPRNAFEGDDGADPRLGVIRSLETLDIEACPGSGKTTLLVAKLAILANRWKSKRQGICVLSHTNAARTEISDRLGSTSAGHVLLRYPHFVGTIHSFVNEFLAIPWLRSKGRQIKMIDTEIALNDRWHRLPWGTRSYLERQHDGPSSLNYAQSDYSGGGKDAYPAGKDTYQQMLKACQRSSEVGYYCFDEMFVWASELLDRFPDVVRTIRRRFPLVFVDEVQDNSELQSVFLHRLFIEGEAPVVRQRFGDSNQAIYHRSGASGAVTDTFPGALKAELPNSFRFGQVIADLAAPLGVRPHALVGRGPTPARVMHASCQSVLFLFDDASVLGVLPAYAEYLIEVFLPEAVARGDFTAVAGVHRADKDDRLPRFMGHYAPDYNPAIAGRQPKPGSLTQYLARARLELAASRNTHPVANCCAEGILHFIRLAGQEVPLSLRKSANRYLLERLLDEGARQQYLTLLDRLIVSRCELSRDGWTRHIAPAVLAIGEVVVGRPVREQWAADFLAWAEVELPPDAEGAPRRSANLFHYPPGEPVVSIRLGSIHGAKGETHTATLVLESFHQTHHLKKLLPWLLGKRPKGGSDNTGADAALIERLKLHYVAMTRPSHLLCLAMRRDAFKSAEIDLMRAKNWRVIECVAPELSSEAVEV